VARAGGVVRTSDGDPDSEPFGVTEGPLDAVDVGDAAVEAEAVGVGDAAAVAESIGVGEPVGSAAAGKGLATTVSASATKTALAARLIRRYGGRGSCLMAPPGGEIVRDDRRPRSRLRDPSGHDVQFWPWPFRSESSPSHESSPGGWNVCLVPLQSPRTSSRSPAATPVLCRWRQAAAGTNGGRPFGSGPGSGSWLSSGSTPPADRLPHRRSTRPGATGSSRW
jgi:hypothetical protein